MRKENTCDNSIWKQCKRDAKRCRNKREYVTLRCTYYDSTNEGICIGNDYFENKGRPGASSLEITDEM